MNSMALGKDYAQQQCSIARALEVVGERWTLLVVRDAFYGVRRYNDFLVHLGAPAPSSPPGSRPSSRPVSSTGGATGNHRRATSTC